MVSSNSQCDVYIAVLSGAYLDLVSAIISKREVSRDIVEIHRRTKNEGIGFLTKTLPSLGKAIDRSLSLGVMLQFKGFKKAPGTQLPAFAGKLISILFSNEGLPLQAKLGEPDQQELTGTGLNQSGSSNTADSRREAQVVALKALRQICYLVYKLNIPYHEKQTNKVIKDFIETDRLLSPRGGGKGATGMDSQILLTAKRLIGRILCNSDPLSGIPKHGPGAVATGEQSPGKHAFSRLYSRLERVYKVDHWFYLNATHLSHEFDKLQQLRPEKSGCAKVVLVPKDSRGPRLISMEPLENQWIQQAQMSVLVQTLESHPLTKGRINFADQSINGRLALEGSTYPYRWSTLDMKEASDRVSLRLVHSLFPKRWFEALYASRSSHTLLPDGTKVRLKKFAPMGSAVCFPVEALVFWALGVSALINHKQKRLREAAANLFVYGDDIITDTEDHSIVCQTLERFDLLVNKDKCCVAGPFKESCGVDAFHGVPVTPLRLREPWSSSRKSGTLLSWVAFSNAAWERGMFVTARIVEELIQFIWNDSIPTISSLDPAVCCFIRPQLDTRPHTQPKVKFRFNKRFQRREVQGIALRPTSILTKVTGYPLLLRYLTELERREPTSYGAMPQGGPRAKSGYFAIAHREKPTRAWTPV